MSKVCSWRVIVFVFIAWLSTSPLFAQNQEFQFQEVSIASPNAAAIQKFVDAPVNTHTGIPSIAIPIYTFQEGVLNLPISLDYHAGGLKVQEYSSWVGAGWSLNAGGAITRTVQGHPDERAPDANNTHFMHEGGFENYLYLPDDGVGAVNYCGRPDVNGASYGKPWDLEPDLFFFNFNGLSGKFYIGPDYRPVMVPEQALHIEIDLDDYDGLEIDGWTITDQQGVKYYFGRTQLSESVEPIEVNDLYTKETGPSGPGRTVSSWYLHTIASPLGDQIKLLYEEEEYSTYSVSLNYRDPGNENSSPVDDISISKMGLRGVRLSSIQSSTASVDFVASSQLRQDLMRYSSADELQDVSNVDALNTAKAARSLKRIDIKNTTGYCKSYELQQGYWTDEAPARGVFAQSNIFGNHLGNLETDKHRLYLQQIQEHSCDNSEEIPPFIFEYFNEDIVPRILSFSMDHWGYYNGQLNDHLTPSLSDNGGANYSENGANRNAAWPYMRAGALKGVTYPTGGSASYMYGHHVLLNHENCNEVVANSSFLNPSLFLMPPHTEITTPYCTAVEQITVPADKEGIYFSVQFNGDYTGEFTFDGISYSSDQTVDLIPGRTYDYKLCLNTLGGTVGGMVVQMYYVDYESCDEVEYAIGGLRVEKTVLRDSEDSPELITEYEYTDDLGNPSGVLFGQPKYITVIRNDENRFGYAGSFEPFLQEDYWSTEGCARENLGVDVFYTASGPQSIRPLRSSKGSHFGYHSVKKKYPFNGHESFIYDVRGGLAFGKPTVDMVDKTVCSPAYDNYPFLPEQHAFGRGDLLFHRTYEEGGGLLRETSSSYEYHVDPTGVIAGIKNKAFGPNATHNSSRYTIKTGHLRKQTDITREIFAAGSSEISNETTFSDHYPYRPVQMKTVDLLTSEVLFQTDYTSAIDLINEGRGCLNTKSQCYTQFIQDSTQIAQSFYEAVNGCANGDAGGCSLPEREIVGGTDWNYCAYDNYLIYAYDLNELRLQMKQCVSTAYAAQQACWTEAGTQSGVSTLVDLISEHRESTVVEQVSSRQDQVVSAYHFGFDDQLRIASIQERHTGSGFTPIEIAREDVEFDLLSAGFDGETGCDPMKSVTIPADREGVKFELQLHEGVTAHLEFDGQDYTESRIVTVTPGATYNYRICVSSLGTGTGTGITAALSTVDFELSIDDEYYLAQALKYNQERIKEITNKDGLITSYLWTSGSANDFDHPIARVIGVPVATVEAAYNGDKEALRVHPDLIHAQVYTYDFEQTKGLLKETDPNGRVLIYSYDKLGRLVLVNDEGDLINKIQYDYLKTATQF